jgi:hypothetical protein
VSAISHTGSALSTDRPLAVNDGTGLLPTQHLQQKTPKEKAPALGAK